MLIYIYTLKITCYYKFIKDIKEMEKMFNEINEALQLCRKEVIELTLLDTLWVTTEKHIYREEHENGICDLAERVAEYLGMEDSVEDVEYIIAEIIEDNTSDINNNYLDIEF